MRGTMDGPWKNRVRETRLAIPGDHDTTQAEIAEKAGICQNTLSAVELGFLSGRKHMDDIANALEVPPTDLFPYYGLLTFEEAAEHLGEGISASLIARRVDEGLVQCTKIAGIRLLRLEDLEGKQLRKRTGLSIRQRIREALATNPEGATTGDLLDQFRPFEPEAEQKTKQSIQSILSRSPEFQPDKSQQPPRWHLVA